MNEHLISDLGRFVDERGVTVLETLGHVRLNIVRSDVAVSVLIPRVVMEWWVEVIDTSRGSRIEDWCDYAGYDTTPEQDLSEDMRTDVVRFVENILARPLRIAGDGRVLEWHAGRDWVQAVPLVPDAEQARVRTPCC